MNLKLVVGIPVVAVLFSFGIIFAMASVYAPTMLIVAAMLLIAGFLIILFVARKPPAPVVQRLPTAADLWRRLPAGAAWQRLRLC